MKTQHIQRLERLAAFLETEQPKLNMEAVVLKQNNETNCGTVCCAIGWTPHVFPDRVCWIRRPGFPDERPVLDLSLDGQNHADYVFVAAELFDLNRDEIFSLFASSPLLRNEYREHIGWPREAKDSDQTDPSAIAADIRDFIQWKKQNPHHDNNETI